MDSEVEDLPMENYEKMTVNAPVLPPKPTQKTPPMKPNLNTLDSMRYVPSGESQNVSKPAAMWPQFHGQVEQQPQVCSDSPEQIYEVPG